MALQHSPEAIEGAVDRLIANRTRRGLPLIGEINAEINRPTLTIAEQREVNSSLDAATIQRQRERRDEFERSEPTEAEKAEIRRLAAEFRASVDAGSPGMDEITKSILRRAQAPIGSALKAENG